ncbi:MAG: phosphate/phosphite/phosphonate ABC transporter substrate-binding protein [Cryobacterium sp.]|nr:phosphate/phosphite/phosphonate ABC transporter substrate-binding protein [Cryobacterium sp.]
MRFSTKAISALVGVTLLTSLAACSTPPADTPSTDPTTEEGTFAKNSDTLVFAVLPDHEGADQDAQPFADYIAAVTGLTVEFYPAVDYVAVIQGLASGQIDIAQISAFTYFQSQNAGADIEPIAAQVTKEGAEAGYYSVALANPAWTGSTLKDFAGEEVCFVNPSSTSGYLVPSGSLDAAGVPTTDVTPVFKDKHDLSAEAISRGEECMIGFAQDIDADPYTTAGTLKEVSRVLVPAAPIALQAGLPASLKATLFGALQGMTQADFGKHGIAMNDFIQGGWFGYQAVDDAYYQSIRDLCAALPDVDNCKS